MLLGKPCNNKLLEMKYSEDQRIFIFTGTPGTGKSGFGLYTVIRLVSDGHLVWYKRKQFESVVFVGSPAGGTELEEIFGVPFQNRTVYRFSDRDEAKLEGIDSIVRVYDPISDSVVHLRGAFFDIIISSPVKLNLREAQKSPFSKTFYSPIWNRDELYEIANFHGVRSLVFVYARFNWCGGVPRLLAHPDYQNIIKEQLRTVTLTDIKEFLSQGVKGSLPTELIHLVSNDDFTAYEYRLASKEVAKHFVDQVDTLKTADVDWFIRGCQGVPFIQALRGKVLELRWHEILRSHGDFEGLKLGTTSRSARRKPSSTVFQISLDQHTEHIFGNLEDLKEFRQTVYYRPQSKIFSCIDAFVREDPKVFGIDAGTNENPFVVAAFQMTVSTSHGLNRTGLEKLAEFFSNITGYVTIVIVFVVESNSIFNSPQPIFDGNHVLGDSNHPAWGYEQYTININDRMIDASSLLTGLTSDFQPVGDNEDLASPASEQDEEDPAQGMTVDD